MEDAYDINFCFPVRELENERLLLTPFIPSVHAGPYFAASSPHPEIYEYLPFGPFSFPDDFIQQFVLAGIRSEPTRTLFAVLDKTTLRDKTTDDLHAHNSESSDNRSPYAIAGIIGLLNASTTKLSVEIGFVIVLPQFRRTHVGSNMIGLLLHFCLEPPSRTGSSEDSDYGPGLGLLRVEWQTHTRNLTSARAAERLGFKLEVTKRWDRVWPAEKMGNGQPVSEGRGLLHSRDSLLFGICWDDWVEGGAKSKVRAIMDGGLSG